MLIQVRYPNDRYDYVKDSSLHDLIESKKIDGFKRSSGWVTIGLDHIRRYDRGSYQKSDFDFDNNPAVEAGAMTRVVYTDDRHDYVTDEKLVNLIESNKIVKYMLPIGWVTVGADLATENIEHNYRLMDEMGTGEAT